MSAVSFSRGRSHSAFTLVELLMVLAVVGLLVGLGSPVLGRARLAGQKAAETAAAKNLITAYLASAQDHNGVLLKGTMRMGKRMIATEAHSRQEVVRRPDGLGGWRPI